MRRLDRSSVPAPTGLAQYHHGTHPWDANHPNAPHRAEIWQSLDEMQQRLCAYCEGSLVQSDQHIEHFRARSAFPKLTFVWANLLGSCARTDSCGHHKDGAAGPYNPDDLIDPASEDPDHFFRFLEDGTIVLRPGLTEAERHRASETIRVLGLQADFGRLRNMRRLAAMTYQGLEPNIEAALMDFTPDQRRAFVREEMDKTAGDPLGTVVRHFLEGLA